MDLSEIVTECQNKSMAKARRRWRRIIFGKLRVHVECVKLLHRPFNGIACKNREMLLDSISFLTKKKKKKNLNLIHLNIF